MKKTSTLLFLLFITIQLSAQQFQWVVSDTLNNQSNPSSIKSNVTEDFAGNVIMSRMAVRSFYYGSDVFGTYEVRKYDANGNVLWSFSMTDSTEVNQIECDRTGNIYLGGSFIGDITLSNGLNFSNTNNLLWNVNYFIIKLDVNGNFIWYKNVSAGRPLNIILTTLAVDHNDNLWFVTHDFRDAYITKADANGDPVDSTLISGARILSSIGFETNGDLYACGATENGTFSAGGQITTITESYAYFLLKLNAQFQHQWLKIAHDETFHLPQLIVDSGFVYVASPIMSNTAWDTVQLHAPQWVFDGFVVKYSANGDVQWGRQVPIQPSSITGRFDPAAGKMIAVTRNHDVLFYGSINGSIDWGNGVIGGSAILSDMLHIVSFNSSGLTLWSKVFGATGYGNFPWSIATNGTDAAYVIQTITNTGNFDVLTVTTGTNQQTFVLAKLDLSNIQTGIPFVENGNEYIFPNPAVNSVRIPDQWNGKLISIYNQQGALMEQCTVNNSVLNVSAFADGIYLLQCNGKNQKLLINK